MWTGSQYKAVRRALCGVAFRKVKSMASTKTKNELSKYLCLLLRHQPEKAELDMDSHGWVSDGQLISGVNRFSGYKLDSELLDEIVSEDNKGRYRFDEKHEKIKCCQGHSMRCNKENEAPCSAYSG